MDKKTYLEAAARCGIDQKNLAVIHDLYSGELPVQLERILSNCGRPVFLDDGVRVMSFDEIVAASKDLHVDFKDKGLIPIADTGENDFVVYDFLNGQWAMYNVVDDVTFYEDSTLQDLL